MGIEHKGTQLGAVLYSYFPWKDSFVAAPLAAMLLNVALSMVLSLITRSDDPVLQEKGLRMLNLVANASISIVTLTFSLTVLSVQIAAQSYSPRLLDEFLKDPMSKVVISVNLGAYAFCYTTNYHIEQTEDADVPYVAIHFLTVHMGLVMISFVNFIHFFINGFRIEKILRQAAAGSLRAARALTAETNTLIDEDPPAVGRKAYKVMADDSGYVTQFRLDDLTPMAQKWNAMVRYKHQIGDYVNRGTVLCYVWAVDPDKLRDMGDAILNDIEFDDNDKDRSRDEKVEKRLGIWATRGIVLSKQRNSDFDVVLGLQQLTDIAVRALSPGVNDPQTCIQCMDHLTSLLATLANMDLGVPHARDSDDVIRVSAPRRSFAFILSLLDSIRQYGSSDLSVVRRAMRLFGDLGVIVTRTGQMDRLEAILMQLEQWMNISKETFPARSSELASVQELYDHMLRTVAESDTMRLRISESGDMKDLQDYETTFAGEGDKAETGDSNAVMQFLREVMQSK